MTTPLVLLALSVGVYIFLRYVVSRRKEIAYDALKAEHKAAKNRLKNLIRQRKALKRDLKRKKLQLAAARREDAGFQSVSASDLSGSDADETEAAAVLLVQQGMIDERQRDNALSKMHAMRMDFVGTCLTLGYIDVTCAQKTKKLLT